MELAGEYTPGRYFKTAIITWVFQCAVILMGSSAPAQTTNSTAQITNVLVMVQKAPLVDGSTYCCEPMVQVVNGLRHLGKDDALLVLRSYLKDNGGYPGSSKNEKVLLICRLLFSNPQGWKHPRLGGPDPEVNLNVADQNPLFPIVLSRGVPFLVILGYNSSGYTSDTADKCVEKCAGFSLVTTDLAETGYEDAARELMLDESFRSLYVDTNVLKHVDKMILDEAKCLDPVIRRGGVIKSTIEIEVH